VTHQVRMIIKHGHIQRAVQRNLKESQALSTKGQHLKISLNILLIESLRAAD